MTADKSISFSAPFYILILTQSGYFIKWDIPFAYHYLHSQSRMSYIVVDILITGIKHVIG